MNTLTVEVHVYLTHTGTKGLASEYETAKAQLEENDTYTQVGRKFL